MRVLRRSSTPAGLSPIEAICALGVLTSTVLIASLPTYRTLMKARAQAEIIRTWDERQAALAEMVASAPWKLSSEATSVK